MKVDVTTNLADRESAIIGTLLECNGAVMPPNLSRLLENAPESFDDARHGQIAAVIRQLRAAQRPVHVLAVAEKTTFDGAALFISQLSNQALSIDLAELEAEPVWKSYRTRRSKTLFGEAQEALERNPDRVDDISRHVRDSLENLSAEGPRRPQDLPPMVDAASFLTSEIPQPRELIAGVLHQGSKLVLGGASKSFKTWTLLDLAVSVAHGRRWLGFDTTQGRVLYVNFEIQDAPWQKRLASVARAKSCAILPNAITLWNLRGKAADFRSLLPQIATRARTENFSLIILDPIYKLYGGTDENKAGDVASLLNGIEELTVEAGAAVAFGAHFSKGNQSSKEAIDRISGSGVFARDPDSILIFTAHEEANAFTVEPILRNFPQVEPFAVRFEFPLMHRDDQLDPARLKQSNAGRKREHDPRKLLKVIANTTKDKPISVSAWAHAAGIARQTLADYLPELRNQDLIATNGEGHTARQFITQKGVKLIGVNT